jgi:hypothetical protein
MQMSADKNRIMPADQTGVQISVVMVSYRTGPVLWAAIDAVLCQEPNTELVLVNNGNEPEVEQRLGEMAKAGQIKLISGQGNVGFARGCNLGVDASCGEYLLLLNPDCILLPGACLELLAEIQRQPENTLLGAELLDPSGAGHLNTCREFATPWRVFVEMTRLHKVAPKHPYFRSLNLVPEVNEQGVTEVPVISGALMFMRTAHYRDLGGMDEDYFLHVEDQDFCLRHHLHGGRTVFVPAARAYHYQSSSAVKWAYVEWHKAKSFSTYFDKHFAEFYPTVFLWLVKFAVFTGFGLRLIKRAVLFPFRRRRTHEVEFERPVA